MLLRSDPAAEVHLSPLAHAPAVGSASGATPAPHRAFAGIDADSRPAFSVADGAHVAECRGADFA